MVDDSPLAFYLKLAESRIWSEGVVGRVYVNAAPDFSTHPEEVGKIKQITQHNLDGNIYENDSRA